MRLLLTLVATLLAAGLAHGGPAIADFAPGQLRHAEALLQQAKDALARGDYERTRRLAAQAALDARLAYGMTDSGFIRQDAIAVHEESARLLGSASGPRLMTAVPHPLPSPPAAYR
jgi:hypothetical protein